MKEQLVGCRCSTCSCTIQKAPKEFDNEAQLCALCRNDIHDKNSHYGKLVKIGKIVDKWYEERYDTDWDFLQGSLMKIRKIVKK